MSEPDLIPVNNLDQSRENPMIWTGEEQAQGVFLDPGETDDGLALLGMPAMQTPATPRLPIDFESGPLLRERLEQLRQAVARAAAGDDGQVLDLVDLDADSRQSMLEMLGEGEVSGSVTLDGVSYTITESVLPGIWRLSGSDGCEYLEVCTIPAVITRAAASLRSAPFALPPAVPGIMNGLALLAEINEHAQNWDPAIEHNRVLNFTLLPTSRADQQLLIDVLGRAELVLDSGGFGNCRVMATTVRHVWVVQYVNGMGKTIMDTIEIGRIPDAALAAREDLEDSAGRLVEILETYLT
ncbi:MAG: hydrogenase expression/formation protein [Halieaceae bacterium]|nr:hydrogenase expression/formation protein [Halieaceae bacterium]